MGASTVTWTGSYRCCQVAITTASLSEVLAVLLNRRPSPVETYNDIDGEVTTFFRVLREQGDELVTAIGLTPFSREEFFIACSTNGHPISDFERARRFFIRARQVRTGLAQNCKPRTLGKLQRYLTIGDVGCRVPLAGKC